MKRRIEQAASLLEAVIERIGATASYLAAAMVLVVCGDVFFRYVLNRSNMAVQELEWHTCAALFLLGTAWTLKHDRHVRVDVLSSRFSDKTRAIINLFGLVALLAPMVVALIYTSWPYAVGSWRLRESSPNPGGLPARYVLKFMIPLAAALLGMQGLACGLRALQTLLGVPHLCPARSTEDAAS